MYYDIVCTQYLYDCVFKQSHARVNTEHSSPIVYHHRCNTGTDNQDCGQSSRQEGYLLRLLPESFLLKWQRMYPRKSNNGALISISRLRSPRRDTRAHTLAKQILQIFTPCPSISSARLLCKASRAWAWVRKSRMLPRSMMMMTIISISIRYDYK